MYLARISLEVEKESKYIYLYDVWQINMTICRVTNKNDKIMDDLSLQPRVTEISFYLKTQKTIHFLVIRICATLIITKNVNR